MCHFINRNEVISRNGTNITNSYANVTSKKHIFDVKQAYDNFPFTVFNI